MSGISRIDNVSYVGGNHTAVKAAAKNSQRMASGKRINSAADDAAGLAVARKLEKEVRGLDAGRENISSGISAANVADGAMAGIADYLQDIREVGIRAMNGLYSDSDRKAMQQQVNGYLDGIMQMAKGTQFNTHTLLDGSMATMDIASNPDGTGMKIQMANSTLEGLGLAGFSVMGNIDIDAIDNAMEKVSEARSKLGASTNGLEHAYSYNSIAAENQVAAQSRIEDLDMAKAVSEQQKNKTLQTYRIMMQKKQMEQDGMVTRLFN